VTRLSHDGHSYANFAVGTIRCALAYQAFHSDQHKKMRRTEARRFPFAFWALI